MQDDSSNSFFFYLSLSTYSLSRHRERQNIFPYETGVRSVRPNTKLVLIPKIKSKSVPHNMYGYHQANEQQKNQIK